MSETPPHGPPTGFLKVLPFWLSLALPPIAAIGAVYGGWWLLLVVVLTWYLFALLDVVGGLDLENFDPETADSDLYWYRLVTLIWPWVQFAMIFGFMIYALGSDHLTAWEQVGLFAGVGVVSGIVGINYSHELMHQRPKLERRLADFLLAMVMYSHFRSEHLLVHHRYVATPKDPVTARYNENFYRFFLRVLPACYVSAFRAEAAMLARKDLPWWHRSNPFWTYWGLQAVMIGLALALGGFWGVLLFFVQSFVAVFQLELVNYIEHYGLSRKHLGDGRYEHVQPRHSWNAAHRVSNWLLINLQRHSDHHFKPNRRFPLLQTYSDDAAPNLPYGYPVMGLLAVFPSLWRRVMNPKVRAWRKQYYPEIEDWLPYNQASNPQPR